MFINPQVAIANGWITGITDSAKQVQPNAIDFTLDMLQMIAQGEDGLYTDDPVFVGEKNKRMCRLLSCNSVDNKWHLERGRVYDGTSNIYVKVPEGVAAILYTRSTLARNGVFLMSGLYDSGYKGHIGFTLYVQGVQSLMLEQGVRVGQIAFVQASSATMYAGSYNHEQGTHYTSPGSQVDAKPFTSQPTYTPPSFAGNKVGEVAVDPTKSPFL